MFCLEAHAHHYVCSEAVTVSGSGTSQTITATGLGSSISYSFEIICIDEVGNRRSVTNSFSTDALSGGGAVGSSGSSSGTATAGVVEEKTVEDAVEDVTPPAVPDAVAEPEAPATDVDEAAFEALFARIGGPIPADAEETFLAEREVRKQAFRETQTNAKKFRR